MPDNESELKHYGVLGMKWGVRKDPKKAYEKAKKKMAKLDDKATKATRKADNSYYSFFTSKRRAKKLRWKADRRIYKAAKWYEDVRSVLGEEKASKMSNKGVNMGERYTNWQVYGLRPKEDTRPRYGGSGREEYLH